MVIKRAMEIARQDGLKALWSRSKNRLAGWFDPVQSATSVSHDEALRWYQHRQHEYEGLVAAVAPRLSDNGVLFDIGANIGFFTLLLAERLKFRGTAHLFEPVPHLAQLCRMTFQKVDYQTTVHEFGLSNQAATRELFLAGNGNLGWNTLIAPKTTPDMTKVEIQLKPFDECGVGATPSFIKVDVEGAEYLVFEGMLGSFKQWQPLPLVLCEVGWGKKHPDWDKELAVFKELEQIGYSLCDLKGQAVEIENLAETTDLLFIP